MTEIVVAQRMWQRRDSAANWTSVNPVLQAGEIGVELSTPIKFKIGNGVSTWSVLPYFTTGAAATYAHTQAVASNTWTINHNMGLNPSVELRTSGGVEFNADVTHTSVNQTVVNLVSAITGTARLT